MTRYQTLFHGPKSANLHPLVFLLLLPPSIGFGNGPITSSPENPTSIPSVNITPTLTTFQTEKTASSASSPNLSPPSAPTPTPSPITNEGPHADEKIINFYFLFIAVFVVILFGLHWFYRRRKKRKIAIARTRGHNEIARDVEGLMGNRRWRYGGRRAFVSDVHREEGLDERGEAPPPYMPDEPPPTLARGDVGLDNGVDVDAAAAGSSIPLRRLSANARKPPDYVEEETEPTNTSSSAEIHDSSRPNPNASRSA